MAKKYNKQFFTLINNNNNNQIVFICYTTKTKLGFCHTVISLNRSLYGDKLVTDTKTSYLDRTWERYDYETTLKKACKKIGTAVYNQAFISGEIRRTY